MAPYRFAIASFVFCLVGLVLMLAPWLHYVWGPEISFYDLGAPQLRVLT